MKEVLPNRTGQFGQRTEEIAEAFDPVEERMRVQSQNRQAAEILSTRVDGETETP